MTTAVRARHVPERTCVGCREARPKREMIRIVRATDGSVDVDSTGKRSGRGAYLCRRESCWETALGRRALERALKTELQDTQRARLADIGRTWSTPSTATSAGSEGEHAEAIE